MTGIRDETLIPNPHFQRRLVWANHHRVEFLKTVLEGLPFPEIFISAGEVNPETGDGTELIVDGQQRVTTLYQYFTGHPDIILDGTNVLPYTFLGPDEKLEFLEYEVVVRDLGPLSEEQTRQIFHRINSTRYSLNAMEVNNSRFDGPLKRFSEDLAGNDFFERHRVFTGLDGRRMNDVRFALTFVITILQGYFNRDDDHEQFLELYNDEFPQEHSLSGSIAGTMDFIEACRFGRRSRFWQKADLLNGLVEIHRALFEDGSNLDPDDVWDRLEAFYMQVEEVTRVADPNPEAAEYYRRVRSGINDRISRAARGEIVRFVLSDDAWAIDGPARDGWIEPGR